MSKIEVDVPARLSDEVQRLVDQGEFLNREQAIEELLTRGVSVYSTDSSSDEPGEDVFTQTAEDQQDPAARDEPGEDYSF